MNKKIQQRFSNVLLFHCGFQLKNQSMVNKCHNYRVLFIYNLSDRLIDSSDLLSKILLLVPSFNLRPFHLSKVIFNLLIIILNLLWAVICILLKM